MAALELPRTTEVSAGRYRLTPSPCHALRLSSRENSSRYAPLPKGHGALGITTAGRIMVSSDATGSDAVMEYLFRFSGRPVRAPQSGFAQPDGKFVEWHRKQVFRAPPRVTPKPTIRPVPSLGSG